MAAGQRLGVGIIGAGNISSQYLKAMKAFPVLDIRGIADMRPEVAKTKGAEFKVAAKTVDELLADPSVDIVVNLTIPRAHVAVGLKAIAAGKPCLIEVVIEPGSETSPWEFLAFRRAGAPATPPARS